MTALEVVRSAVRSFAIRIKAIPANLQTVASRGSWWPIIGESYAGAWQENVTVTLENVLRHPTVFACINLISGDVAKLRLRLVEEVEPDIWQEVEVPAFSPVLRKPNHYQTRIQFYQSWMLSKLIHGSAFVLLQRDQRGVVVSEYVLDPNRIQPLVAPNGDLYYEVKQDNLSRQERERIVIPATEVIVDRYLPLYHTLIGFGPIHAIGVSATQSLTATSNATNFFANGAYPGGLLLAPSAISDETATRLKTAWETNYGGANSGRIAILGDGLKYEPLKPMSAVDSQMVESQQWIDEKICSAFLVPGFKVGVGDFPPYNSSVQLNQDYYSRCVQVHLESIELLQDQALGLTERINGRRLGTEFDVDGLIRMDTASQIEAEGKAVGSGLKTINEGRKKLGLPGVDGGDTVYLQQQNWTLEQLNNRETTTPAPALPPTPGEENMPMNEETAAAFVSGMKRKALELATDAA